MINIGLLLRQLSDFIFNYVSNNFEIIFYAETSLFIAFLVFIVIIVIRQIFFWIEPLDFFKNALFYGILLAEVFMIYSTGYVYWENYKNPPERYLVPEIIEPDTSWVKQDIELFYVSEMVNLESVNIKGNKPKEIFKADSNIEEYSFSPNGKYLLVSTKTKLFKVDVSSKKHELIESIDFTSEGYKEKSGENNKLSGVISGVSWSPDSNNFCYETSLWSKYSSQDSLYIYNLEKKEKKALRNFSNVISFIYWGRDGKDIYYLKKEALDTSFSGYSYDVNVYRIPLTTLKPELISQIPYDKSKIPEQDLALRGIDIFVKGRELSFGRLGAKEKLISDEGSRAGIDENDYFYVMKDDWYKKKLFKVRRMPAKDQDFPRYQYGGGELVIKNIRWLPKGKYIIMEHKTFGTLVLDPWYGKIGKLPVSSRMIGFYNDSFIDEMNKIKYNKY